MSGFVGVRSSLAGLLILCAASATGMGQSAVGHISPSRIVRPIDETRVVTLQGNVHPMARREFDQGTVAAETCLGRMVLLLELSAGQQAELDALVAAQHDPDSPLYRQWLTPAEYGVRFGASPEDIAHVAAWLTGHGFTVEELPASNRLVIFSGTAGEVEETFHSEIHRYSVGGLAHIANMQEPQIPAALAGVVGGVVSLHDFRRRSQIKALTPLTTAGALSKGNGQPVSECAEGPAAGAEDQVDPAGFCVWIKAPPRASRFSAPVGPSTADAVESRPLYSSGSTHYLFPADWASI